MPEKKDPQSYRPAPEVAEIAEDIIAEHYKPIRRLQIPIRYQFCSRPEKVRGSEALGTCRLVSGLNAYLAGNFEEEDEEVTRIYNGVVMPKANVPVSFFVITMWEQGWHFLTEHQQIAVTDHELAHVGHDTDDNGNLKLSVNPHGIEDFPSVIRRRGIYHPNIEAIRRAIEEGPQLSFDEIRGLKPTPMPDLRHVSVNRPQSKVD